MPRHKPVAISGADLINAIERDTSEPWMNVIGWDCDPRFIEIEAIEEKTGDQWAEYDKLEAAERTKASAAWFIVRWPEHVLTPKCNSDASYHLADHEADARDRCKESI